MLPRCLHYIFSLIRGAGAIAAAATAAATAAAAATASPEWPDLVHPLASVIDTPLPTPPEHVSHVKRDCPYTLAMFVQRQRIEVLSYSPRILNK